MQRFFPDFESLDRFTLSLDCLDQVLQCPHCSSRGHLVSHGVIYRQRSMHEREAVGKRVLCSNRYQHTGCGRTVQLSVAGVLPGRRYGAAQLFVFVSALLMHASVVSAYQTATGQTACRHAWRWLKTLMRQLTDYRCWLGVQIEPLSPAFEHRCRRLRLLLPSLQQLFARRPTGSCSGYQLASQSAFM